MTNRIIDAQTAHLLTTTPDATWNARMADFVRRYELYHADIAYGPYSFASERQDRVTLELTIRFGRDWRNNPLAVQANADALAEMQVAEDAQMEAFLRPLWAAERELALTPAPTIAAAAFKNLLIEQEDVWNDNQMPADLMDVIAADFARLAGEE